MLILLPSILPRIFYTRENTRKTIFMKKAKTIFTKRKKIMTKTIFTTRKRAIWKRPAGPSSSNLLPRAKLPLLPPMMGKKKDTPKEKARITIMITIMITKMITKMNMKVSTPKMKITIMIMRKARSMRIMTTKKAKITIMATKKVKSTTTTMSMTTKTKKAKITKAITTMSMITITITTTSTITTKKRKPLSHPNSGPSKVLPTKASHGVQSSWQPFW
mmetsp:Transcript_17337/g.37869  ORF Transcript_17337/g.37869 Transcript_17337/m.37869 type:complete len:218 (+) Transcript_17337:484-1137(+)